ncbi:MAG: hypothetical protein JNL70_22640 [Saprospiraceae bacterium]|nr:hypothetical protein [Saprospiraceae bacterium]
MYYSPNYKQEENSTYNTDVLSQLRHLKDEVHNKNAGIRMQQLFPEGFVFTNVLYGLAWADFAELIKPNHPLFQEANEEIKWSIAEINSEQGKAIFSDNLPLKYGAFYNGWSSFLMAKYLKLNQLQNKDPSVLKAFSTVCDSINKAVLTSPHAYLESYPNSAWQGDNIVCLASLVLHDKIYPPQYKTAIDTFLNRFKTHLDPETGMIGHSFSPQMNVNTGGVRGSSQSLINSFLPLIDSAFAKQQFELYKQHFIDYKLGLPAVREYPKNWDGDGDIDSGPVIWEVGTVASIVAIRAMAENGEKEFYKPIRNAIEAFGFPNHWGLGKKYVFGQIPIADAFLAWCHAKSGENLENPPVFWRMTFQLFSLFVILLLFWLAWKL